ncbi:ADP-ribosyltransferase [Spiroplasma sp. Moj]|uniref:ADP-ribosyltransferase n=1 Tax=Spiroplasma sp. Moj TaxID=1922342 RepID=UPI0039EED232|nr:lethal factor [Spiroplasma sp. Moj]
MIFEEFIFYVPAWGRLKQPFNKKFNKNLRHYKDRHEEARNGGRQLYNDWENKLTKNEKKEFKEYLEQYTGSNYEPINEYLRKTNGKIYHDIEAIPAELKFTKNDLKKVNDKILKLDKSFQKAKTNEKLVVFRRVSGYQFSDHYLNLRDANNKINRDLFTQIRQDYTGKKFTQHSFLSTSLSKDPNKSYSGECYPILLRISLPKGTKAIYVDEISKYYGQNELLLNRGYTFRYHNFLIVKDKTTGKESIKVEISLAQEDKKF